MGKIMLRGMLASEHEATPHIQALDETAGDTQTTTSTGLVDMPNMSITFNSGTHTVLVVCSVTVSNNTAGDGVVVAVVIDGVNRHQGRFMAAAANQAAVISLTRLYGLTAGSHTIKLQWEVYIGGTATVTDRSLQVLELKP